MQALTCFKTSYYQVEAITHSALGGAIALSCHSVRLVAMAAPQWLVVAIQHSITRSFGGKLVMPLYAGFLWTLSQWMCEFCCLMKGCAWSEKTVKESEWFVNYVNTHHSYWYMLVCNSSSHLQQNVCCSSQHQ